MNISMWEIPQTFFGNDDFIISGESNTEKGERVITCLSGEKKIVLWQSTVTRTVALISVQKALPETMVKVHDLIRKFNSELQETTTPS